tara:strand:+ start:3228 stop:3617 length:390 start_codon:yes stop_codon:yes gene_type:complete
MSDNIQLPTVNDYHHNKMKVGALDSIIFDLERTADPAVTAEKRALWLGNARKAREAAQSRVDALVGFEAPSRYLDNVEEIEARQEIWAKYWETTLEAEVLKEVYNYTKPSFNEERRAAGEETEEDLSLD